ncbi:hypothetical protein IGI04_015628 [Brassica rapa subsp. trilocularis]|uniref:non-specific serine/threonine protein kinase n=1 Tax=Brassica rapa subsp. trilocularis TaxID=1813537 RepID=A0ABQ7MT44_BRACM|nr:hypothetical protein IGI04_015628 [Brassica rapa subsp. trilocularis]
MINLYQSLTKSWSFATIWMLFVIPSYVLSDDEHHKKCAPSFGCANQRNLTYPFWIPERKECGHPEFKVNCSGDIAEFSRSSVKFQILENKFYSIRLAIKDYQSNLCPRHPENVEINQYVLPFSQDTMLSIFYYNCSAPRVDVPPGFYIRKLDCGNDNGRRSYFVSSALSSWDSAILENSSASCERNVTIPVSRYALSIEDGNPTLEAIEKALKYGFEVMFTTECWECKQSQGSCGYNDSSRSFVCYCVDGPHKRTCPHRTTKSELTKIHYSNKFESPSFTRSDLLPSLTSGYYYQCEQLTTQKKLGIGFAGGFFGSILLAGATLCLIYRRRKKLAAQYTSKQLTTSSIYPTMEMGTGVACGFLGFRKSETSHHPRDHQLKALPCPSNRPPMNRVVEIMEGSLDAIEVPPKHSLQLSAAPLAESSWLSEENSDYSEVLL